MEWIWNYVFALLTSHSITQMDSCRHGCWAKLVTLSPNNIAITKSHTNYDHIGIFIGPWVWQPKQCPLRERAESLGPVPVPHNGLSSDMTITGAGWGMDLLGPRHRPRPWPVSAVTPQCWTRINVRSFSQQSSPSDMNHIPLARPVSSVENQMGNCLSSCPRRVRDK